MRGIDVAIAGCGPCGLAAALLLERNGHRVTLFERFDQPRPIGSGLLLQPTGLAVLAELGLSERVMREGARVDRLYGLADGRVVLDVHYAALKDRSHFGVGIHRASLFSALFDAALARKIPIETNRTITSSRLSAGRRRLTFADGSESAAFDLVVDALGTWTPLAASTGRQLAYGALWASLDWPAIDDLDPHVLTQRYRRSDVMAGILPIGPGSEGRRLAAFFWSLRGDRFARWQQDGMQPWKAEVRALWPQCQPLLDQITDDGQLTFARYAHRTLRRSTETALIHIGDAWHSSSPQLGQGANMALLDAWALAQGIEAGDTIAKALQRATALRRRHVHIYQMLSWMFTPVYQSDSRTLPFLRDRVAGPLSKLWPATVIQAAMVSGLVGNPLVKLGLNATRQLELRQRVT